MEGRKPVIEKKAEQKSPNPSPQLNEQKEINFDLNEIKDFNPALVYGHDVELSTRPVAQDSNNVEWVQHGNGQYKDLFKAYYYAQTVILPTIRGIGIDKITAEQLLEWLNQLHQRIGATLAKDQGNPQLAGSYSKQQVLRWKQGGMALEFVVACYQQKKSAKTSDLLAKAKDQMGTSDYENFLPLVNDGTFDKLLSLLKKVGKDNKIKVAKDQEAYLDKNSPFHETILAVSKLTTQFHANKLTTEEKGIVQRIVNICPSPPSYPRMMRQMAEDLLTQWRNCDAKNHKQVAALGSYAFYHLTEIHAYFNGNGRLATAFINIVFRSLEHRSILIRTPAERDNPLSSYSQAIASLNQSRALLTRHIEARLQNPDIYKNDKLAAIVTKKIKIDNLIESIQFKFPLYNLNIFYRKMLQTFSKQSVDALRMLNLHNIFINEKQVYLYMENNKQLEQRGISPLPQRVLTDEELGNEFSLFGLNYQISALSKLTEELQQLKTQPKLSQLSPVVQRSYSKQEKEAMLSKLGTLTGNKGWHTRKGKTGLAIMLELGELDPGGITKARTLVKALTNTKAMQASLSTYLNSEKRVILLESINPKALDKVTSLGGINTLSQEVEEKLEIKI